MRYGGQRRTQRWAYAFLNACLASTAFGQQLPGVTVMDRSTSAPVMGPGAPTIALQLKPILVGGGADVSSVLRMSGIDAAPSTIQAVKSLNPGAFEGQNLRPGSQLYVPAPRLTSPQDLQRYAIRFDEPDLSKLQLRSDALSARTLASRIETASAQKPDSAVLREQAGLLRQMSTHLERLGTRHSVQLGGPELSSVSFHKELAEHLSTSSINAGRPRQIQNLHLLSEVTQSVAAIVGAADKADPRKRIGKKVIVHYAHLPSKKPMHGRQLYALPRGMQAFINNFPPELIARALALHRFDGMTSPSSRLMAWGHFVVIAGPPHISDEFVKKVMKNPGELDITGVSVTTGSTWEELELFLAVRNP